MAGAHNRRNPLAFRATARTGIRIIHIKTSLKKTLLLAKIAIGILYLQVV